jgi:predicted unusual protein kinase regulating ubiquinone biosynthesis (AarF/ABC1/UbiB family)
VAALGTMKGAAMKVGQVMSFLDPGFVPEEYREEFQRKLAALRDAAPTVTFKQMGRVIEEELGDKLEEVFEEFDEEPIAAASIGQVYRARLADGREVAVKVQYPGVAAAVRADLQNLGMILRPWARRSVAASRRSSTTSWRPRTSGRWPGSSAVTRSSSCPASSPPCPASGCWSASTCMARDSRI